MRKLMAFLVVFLLIFITTAGCIDIHLMKDLLVPREEEEMEYHIVEYNFNHSFVSIPPDNILEIYSEEFKVPVKPLTQHMRFDIDIVMRSASEIWETINDTWPGEIPEWLEDLVKQLLELAGQRYIEVTITLPDGFELYKNKFNDTENVELPLIYNPGEGNWTIAVDAAGGGIEFSPELAYNDSFYITVVINEPKE